MAEKSFFELTFDDIRGMGAKALAGAVLLAAGTFVSDDYRKFLTEHPRVALAGFGIAYGFWFMILFTIHSIKVGSARRDYYVELGRKKRQLVEARLPILAEQVANMKRLAERRAAIKRVKQALTSFETQDVVPASQYKIRLELSWATGDDDLSHSGKHDLRCGSPKCTPVLLEVLEDMIDGDYGIYCPKCGTCYSKRDTSKIKEHVMDEFERARTALYRAEGLG